MAVRQAPFPERSLRNKQVAGLGVVTRGSSSTIVIQEEPSTTPATQIINCDFVAISNITLSGTPIADAITGQDGDIILCTGQNNKAENGPYIIRTSVSWQRMGVMRNQLYTIALGTQYHDSVWMLTSDTVSNGSPLQIQKLFPVGLKTHYRAIYGDNFDKSFLITHNLDTYNITVQVWKETAIGQRENWQPALTLYNQNAIILDFGSIPTYPNDIFHITIIGF